MLLWCSVVLVVGVVCVWILCQVFRKYVNMWSSSVNPQRFYYLIFVDGSVESIVMEESAVVLNLVVIGDEKVGKSSLVVRLATNEYHECCEESKSFISRRFRTPEGSVDVRLWDIAGQVRRAVCCVLFVGSRAVVLSVVVVIVCVDVDC